MNVTDAQLEQLAYMLSAQPPAPPVEEAVACLKAGAVDLWCQASASAAAVVVVETSMSAATTTQALAPSPDSYTMVASPSPACDDASSTPTDATYGKPIADAYYFGRPPTLATGQFLADTSFFLARSRQSSVYGGSEANSPTGVSSSPACIPQSPLASPIASSRDRSHSSASAHGHNHNGATSTAAAAAAAAALVATTHAQAVQMLPTPTLTPPAIPQNPPPNHPKNIRTASASTALLVTIKSDSPSHADTVSDDSNRPEGAAPFSGSVYNDGTGARFSVHVDVEAAFAALSTLPGIRIEPSAWTPPIGDTPVTSGGTLPLLPSLVLLERLVHAINHALYRRYDADISSALTAIRGTAAYSWLGQGRGELTITADRPIVWSYFARVPASSPPGIVPPSTHVLACNGFIWNGDPEIDFTLPCDAARSYADIVRAGTEELEFLVKLPRAKGEGKVGTPSAGAGAGAGTPPPPPACLSGG